MSLNAIETLTSRREKWYEISREANRRFHEYERKISEEFQERRKKLGPVNQVAEPSADQQRLKISKLGASSGKRGVLR